jgi:hypothetical protein
VFGPDSPGYDELKAKEIEIATADYSCNHQVGLDEVRVEVFWRNVAEFFTDRETQIAAWRKLVDDARSRGQQMLRG